MIAYALRLEFNINNVVFGATFEFSALFQLNGTPFNWNSKIN